MLPRMTCVLFLTLASFCASATPASNTDLSAKVGQFIDAYNQQQAQDMLKLVADNIRWMSVKGAEISVETADKQALANYLEQAFVQPNPDAGSRILSISQSGPFVHTEEQAYWQVDGKPRQQCSLAIYEFAQGLIINVWYYSAYSCPAPAKETAQ